MLNKFSLLAPWETYGKQYREYAHKYVKALLTSVTLFLQQKVNNVFFFFLQQSSTSAPGTAFSCLAHVNQSGPKKTSTFTMVFYRTALVGWMVHIIKPIVHFTVVCLVAKPLNRSEAEGDLVMIQTLLLFKCKLLCYHAN